jgi:hypothetical protein
MAFVLRRTVFGRRVFALGSSEAAARACGIAIDRLKLAVYGVAGLFFGLAGVMQMSRLRQGDPTVAAGTELDVIAAVVIGGGSLSGGEGSIVGSMVGALVMAFLRNGSQQMGWPSYVQEILIGVIIVIAVAIDRWRHAQQGTQNGVDPLRKPGHEKSGRSATALHRRLRFGDSWGERFFESDGQRRLSAGRIRTRPGPARAASERLGPLITRPSKTVCTAPTTPTTRETNAKIPEEPVIFFQGLTASRSRRRPAAARLGQDRLGGGAAVVIGRRARYVAPRTPRIRGRLRAPQRLLGAPGPARARRAVVEGRARTLRPAGRPPHRDSNRTCRRCGYGQRRERRRAARIR